MIMKIRNILGMSLLGLVMVGCNATQTEESAKVESGRNTINAESNAVEESGDGYAMSEVAQHNNQDDCWLVINGKVYDVTSFIPDHPGGNEILKGCGKDATSLFEGEREHSGSKALDLLPKFEIGVLKK